MDPQTLLNQLIKKSLSDREAGLTAVILEDMSNPQNIYSLIAVFAYDVYEGGFAQFIYNSNGIYLAEVAEALETVGADSTGVFLERAINACLDDDKSYKKFLAGNFADCFFKKKLDKISADYAKSETPLETESLSQIVAIIDQCNVD